MKNHETTLKNHGLWLARPSGRLASRLWRSARKWEVIIFRDTHTLHHNIYNFIIIIFITIIIIIIFIIITIVVIITFTNVAIIILTYSNIETKQFFTHTKKQDDPL